MKCSFKRLSVNDIQMVMKMNTQFRDGFVAYDCAVRFLENPDNWLFAAIHDGTIIGFAYGYALNRLTSKQNMLYIHEVGILPSFQRQGIGFALMNALFDQCAKSNIQKCFLTCYQNNDGANALYRKLGGEVPPESGGEDTVYFFPCSNHN